MTAVALAQLTAALQSAGQLKNVSGTPPLTIKSMTDDSRLVRPGALFVAVRGTSFDGHDFLGAAEGAGATVVIVEDPERTTLPALVVRDARRAAAIAAAAYYNDPAGALIVIGVTGTNGKSTTVALLRHLLDLPHERSASIGTLGVRIGSEGREHPGGAGLTTPGAIELQRVLRELVDAGIATVAIEASSHALEQHRLDGIPFDAAIFTNLTRDHLDYHQTMEAYFASKARLVGLLARTGVAVVNQDDRAWDKLPDAPRRVTFGLRAQRSGAQVHATYLASNPSYSAEGSSWALYANGTSYDVELPLLGDFNVANALGAAAAVVALGRDPAEMATRLWSVPQVPGRLERIADVPVVLRDYAHTPDALERALAAVRPFARGRLIVVFGCGGDRDPGKRPQMGAVAARHADHAIITSDNPRTEDPDRILDEIEAGMTGSSHERIEDRRAAIGRALSLAHPVDDLVLLAGKGHETYQIRGTEKTPFDEAAIVGELLARRSA